jgi:hypothetical protein
MQRLAQPSFARAPTSRSCIHGDGQLQAHIMYKIHLNISSKAEFYSTSPRPYPYPEWQSVRPAALPLLNGTSRRLQRLLLSTVHQFASVCRAYKRHHSKPWRVAIYRYHANRRSARTCGAPLQAPRANPYLRDLGLGYYIATARGPVPDPAVPAAAASAAARAARLSATTAAQAPATRPHAAPAHSRSTPGTPPGGSAIVPSGGASSSAHSNTPAAASSSTTTAASAQLLYTTPCAALSPRWRYCFGPSRSPTCLREPAAQVRCLRLRGASRLLCRLQTEA